MTIASTLDSMQDLIEIAFLKRKPVHFAYRKENKYTAELNFR